MGDLWIYKTETDNEIKYCVHSRAKNESYGASDWGNATEYQTLKTNL
jgi:hypothetical protein